MYIYEKKSLKMTTLQLVFDAGSLFEKDYQRGTMHLMEHLVCKNFRDMYSELTRLSIEWNAYTTDEFVIIHFTGLESRLTPDVKRTLVNKIIGGLNVTEEMFNVEKNVVLQEYSDCFNDPIRGTYLNILRTFYNNFSPIGKKSEIEAFTLDDAKYVYEKFFTKPARIIEVGPTETDFSKINYNVSFNTEPKKIKFKKVETELENVPASEKASVVWASKKMVSKSDYPFMKMAIAMLTSGIESPFYEEIRVKQGLAYYSDGEIQPFRTCSALFFDSCTTPENKKKLVETYKMMFSNIDDFLTRERFEVVYSEMDAELEKHKILRAFHVTDLVRRGLVSMPRNMKKFTFEKVRDVAKKYINIDNMKLLT